MVRGDKMYEEVTYQEEYYPSDNNGRDIGIVNAGSLNVREEPNFTSKSIKILRKGDIVEILNEIDGWYHIADPCIGYCKTEFIDI